MQCFLVGIRLIALFSELFRTFVKLEFFHGLNNVGLIAVIIMYHCELLSHGDQNPV